MSAVMENLKTSVAHNRTIKTPYVTCAVTLCSLALYFCFQPFALSFAPDQGYTLLQSITCHLAHWNAEHLFWSLGTFAVLGCLCETSWRNSFYLALIGSAFAIPMALSYFPGQAAFPYGGISGIDSALFALLAGNLLRAQYAERNWAGFAVGCALLFTFTAKIMYELSFGEPVFLQDTEGMTPVPLAHLVGGGVGLFCANVPMIQNPPNCNAAVR